MRLPRDLSGKDLIRSLRSLGFQVTRQTGSHIRLTTTEKGTHHITVPNHDPLRIGTMAAILDSVAEHVGMTRDQLITQLKLS